MKTIKALLGKLEDRSARLLIVEADPLGTPTELAMLQDVQGNLFYWPTKTAMNAINKGLVVEVEEKRFGFGHPWRGWKAKFYKGIPY